MHPPLFTCSSASRSAGRTHDQNEALAAADQIILLTDGWIVQTGDPLTIYREPRSFFTADFLGANNIFHGRLRRDGSGSALIEGEGWSLPGTIREEGGLEDGAPARAVVRVEEVSVADQPATDGLEVGLTDSIYLGDEWEYRLTRGGLRAKAHGPRPLPPGKVWARIPPESV